jgi:hypothetical protein
MVEQRARDAIRRWDTLKSARTNFEQQWQEIAELVRPNRADFTVTRMPGEKRGLQQFDASSATMLGQLAAGLWGSVTNSATEWFQVQHPDPVLGDLDDVKQWLDDARLIMQDALGAEGQRFYTEALEFYADLGAFGTSLFYVDGEPGERRITYSTRPLTECCIDQDDRGRVDTVIRRFEWTARQAVQHWGNRAGKAALKAVEHRPDDRFVYLHVVQPNADRDPRRLDARGKGWQSLHISVQDMAVVQEGGFEEFPYMVARWGTASRGLYGDSPAMQALTDIKVLNTIERTKLVAGQKAADPPLLASDENDMRGIRVQPGGITYGGVDINGNPRVRPLQTGADFRIFEGMAEQKRQAIREAFHNTLMQMAQRPNITATEVLEVKEERLRMLGPQLSRIETEFLDPLTRRVFALLYRAQAFPPLPEALMMDARVKVEYVSQLAVAQRSGAAASVMRVMQSVLPLAQSRPEVLDVFDFDAAARAIAEGYGLPPKLLRDPRVVEAERQQRAQAAAQAEEAAQLAASARPARDAAGAVRDLMGAEQMAQGMAQ